MKYKEIDKNNNIIFNLKIEKLKSWDMKHISLLHAGGKGAVLCSKSDI